MSAAKTYYAIGDDDGVHVYETIQACVEHMTEKWGWSTAEITENEEGRILQFTAAKKPELKIPKATWTL